MSQGSGKVPETTDLLLSGFSEVGERRALGSRSNSNLRLPVSSCQFPVGRLRATSLGQGVGSLSWLLPNDIRTETERKKPKKPR